MDRTASASVFNHSGPLRTSYANGGPVIKANGAGNGKPTGHREVGLNFLQGLALFWMPTMITKHGSNISAQESANFGNETEVMVFEVSYFCRSYKGQHRLSYGWPAKGKWKMCHTSTLSSTMLHACNRRGIVFQK